MPELVEPDLSLSEYRIVREILRDTHHDPDPTRFLELVDETAGPTVIVVDKPEPGLVLEMRRARALVGLLDEARDVLLLPLGEVLVDLGPEVGPAGSVANSRQRRVQYLLLVARAPLAERARWDAALSVLE